MAELTAFVSCSTEALGNDGRTDAHKRLLSVVEEYFASARQDSTSRVHKTFLPPIYFQFRGKIRNKGY